MRSLILTILWLAITQTCYSQTNKPNYNLLWEITGNDLQKPSYLFGTIHLKDKRAFEFPDSMFLKLDACEAFATEVHPDSAFLFYSEMFLSKDTTNFLKKTMSPEAYEKLKKELSEQEGIALDSLKNKNPFFIESLFDRKPPIRADDKDLFLDYYLCRMAKRSGKSIYGLEKVEDHRSMVNLFFERFEPDSSSSPSPAIGIGLERLVQSYQTGNLEHIQYLLNLAPRDTAYEKAALINRNIIMADNMEKIMPQQSLFATMGTAHLPGEGGVIDLLQKKGYTLRPVKATFTGLADQFKINKQTSKWHPYRENYHKFNAQFPGPPYTLKYEQPGRMLLDHYIHYNDPFEKNNYFIKVIGSFRKEGQSIDSLLLDDIHHLFLRKKKDHHLKTKKITSNGIEGIEFNAQIDSSRFIRGQVYYTISSIYFVGVTREDKELNHKDIDRYFNAFQIDKPASYNWKKFNSKEGAFSVLTPYPPDLKSINFPVPNLEGETFNLKMNLFTIKDFESGFLYMIRYNGIGEGNHLESDTSFFEMAQADISERMGQPDTSFTIFKDGYEGREIHFIKHDFLIRVQLYLRGTRTYLLLAQNLKSPEFTPNMEDFFNSFTFAPFEYSPLSNYNFEEEGYSINFPKQPITETHTPSAYEYPSQNIFFSYAEDPINNINYYTTKTTYSPYYQVDTIENLLDDIIENQNTYTDSVIFSKKIMIDSLPGRYFKITSKLSAVIQHYYTFIKGNEVFQAYIFPPKEMPEEKILDFLSSLKIADTPVNIDLTSRKIEHIIKGFSSPDSTIFAAAKTALSYHPLVEQELPFIYSALEKEYPEDTLLYGSPIDILCNHLEVTNDSLTISIISSNYEKYPENEIRKTRLLSTLGRISKPGSLQKYLSLLDQHQDLNNDYSLLYPFRDSIEFLANNYPIISAKIKQNSNWSSQIFNIIQTHMYNAPFDYSFLNVDIPIFMDTIQSITDKQDLLNKDSIGHFDQLQDYYSLLKIVGKLNLSKQDIKYLKSLLKIKDHSIKSKVILSLLNLDQKISKKHWRFIAEKSPINKYYFMEELYIDSLLNKAPKEWLSSPEELARLGFFSRFQYDNYYDVEFNDFKVIQSFPFTYNKKNYKVYVIKYQIPDHEGDYIGLNSVLDEPGKYDFYAPIFDYSYSPIEKGKQEEQIQKYLEWYKKEDLKRENEKKTK